MNAIRNLSGYRAPIQELFYRINNGEFSESIPRKPRSGNAFYSRYINRVNPRIAYSNNPTVKSILDHFYSKGLKSEKPWEIGESWSEFKEYWANKGVVVSGHWSEKLADVKGYVIDDIEFDTGSAILSLEEVVSLDARMRRRAEEHAAKQALKGKQEAQKWERLTKAQIEAIEEANLSKELWDNMSVTEQEQWLNCHA